MPRFRDLSVRTQAILNGIVRRRSDLKRVEPESNINTKLSLRNFASEPARTSSTTYPSITSFGSSSSKPTELTSLLELAVESNSQPAIQELLDQKADTLPVFNSSLMEKLTPESRGQLLKYTDLTSRDEKNRTILDIAISLNHRLVALIKNIELGNSFRDCKVNNPDRSINASANWSMEQDIRTQNSFLAQIAEMLYTRDPGVMKRISLQASIPELVDPLLDLVSDYAPNFEEYSSQPRSEQFWQNLIAWGALVKEANEERARLNEAPVTTTSTTNSTSLSKLNRF